MKVLKTGGILLIILLVLSVAWNPSSAVQLAAAPGSPPSIAPALDQAHDDRAEIQVPSNSDLVVTSAGSFEATQAVAEGPVDLAVKDFGLVQAVPGEPLVIGKPTVARVRVALPEDVNVDALVHVDVDGKVTERTVNLVGPMVTATLRIDAPSEVKPVTARVLVTPVGDTTDPDLSNNASAVTYQTVQTSEKVVAFFLPVDWTPDDQSKYDFNTAFKRYVQNAGDFMIGTYPLPTDQVVVDYAMTPYMPTPFEKTLADSQGKFSTRNALALYGSLSIAGRRSRPDATIVIGVLPPGWFRKHGQPRTEGFTLTGVRGIVTTQYEPNLQPIVAAHESAHLYLVGEDYDFAVKPNRPCFQILVPGYWVQRDQELLNTPSKKLCTFMSAADPKVAYWADSRLYEYLMAKFAMNGGTASAPLILSASMTWIVSDQGYPDKVSGDAYRFEPTQSVYCSVAGVALKAGSTLEAKLYRGNTLVSSADPQTTVAGNKWYPFLMAESDTLKEGLYRVDVYLDGQLVKSNPFEVKASK
jgi:hypothetical protein